MKKKAIIEVIIAPFIGSLSFFLSFRNQLFIFWSGNTLSFPRACKVLGAIITDPNAEDTAAHAKPIGIIGPQIAISLITIWLFASSSSGAERTNFKAIAK